MQSISIIAAPSGFSWAALRRSLALGSGIGRRLHSARGTPVRPGLTLDVFHLEPSCVAVEVGHAVRFDEGHSTASRPSRPVREGEVERSAVARDSGQLFDGAVVDARWPG